MKSEWYVQNNYVAGKGHLYIACRVRNTNQVIHSGNIEHYGEYTEDREAAQEIVDKLNSGEIIPED